MPEKIAFIGREPELAFIDHKMQEWGTLRIVCIEAGGGIGKTCLLRQIQQHYTQQAYSHLLITDIIDFDDYTFHLEENLTSTIARMLDESVFQPYLEGLLEYRRLEKAGERLELQLKVFTNNFIKFVSCLNKITRQKRVVLFFDTTESLVEKALIKENLYVNHFTKISKVLKNGLILIAGRNAKSLGNVLQQMLPKNVVTIRELRPFSLDESARYLRQKEQLKFINLEPELAQKLIFLAGGKPILIDLAVEWRNRGISLDWLFEKKLEEMSSLPEEEIPRHRQEFERELVKHIIQTRKPLDWLLLLMSHVYPLNPQMIAMFLDMTLEEAISLFQKAQTYVFIKNLPDGRIMIHDEMRRMIQEYVWPVVDPQKQRQRRYSEQAAQYLENRIADLQEHIHKLERTVEHFAKAPHSFAQIDLLEKELWIIKKQYLHYTMMVDLNKGVSTFATAFDDTTKSCQFSLRRILLMQMQQESSLYNDRISGTQRYEIERRRAKYLADLGKYQDVKEVLSNLLEGIATLFPEQQISLLIERGSAEIRIGNLKKGVADFERAVALSNTNRLTVQRINALNYLGYAYRLVGDFESALHYYTEARDLCLQEGGKEREELQETYGWIANNLIFVLSIHQDTRQAALELAEATIEHWQIIGNDIGLGAAYLVQGELHYRNASLEQALEAFVHASDIFTPMDLRVWLSQIYSWRGAVYEDMGKTDIALIDLHNALKTGSGNGNIIAMTLHRMARVYLSLQKWEEAEEYCRQSLDHGRKIPDYIYWLASLAKLAFIASRKGEYDQFGMLHQMLQDYLAIVSKPEKHPLGVTYLSFAQLLLQQNTPEQLEQIIDFLSQGIDLLAEVGSYARTDILRQLSFIEQDFSGINPEIIRNMGQKLYTLIIEKPQEKAVYKNIASILSRWAAWPEEGVGL